MKKILTISLALILAISLIACSTSSDEEFKAPTNVTTGNNAEDIQQDNQTEKPQKPVETEVTINETVLVDESGVKITAKSLEIDEIFGPEIKLLIENNSGKDLTFQCRNAPW